MRARRRLMHPRIVCAAAVVILSVVVGGIAVGSSGQKNLDGPLNPTPIVAPRVATAEPATVRADPATRAARQSRNEPPTLCTPPPPTAHAADVIVFTTYSCP